MHYFYNIYKNEYRHILKHTAKMKVFILLSVLSLIAGEYDYGYRVDNQLLKSFNDVGERSCCEECIAYTNCQSVNYNKNNYSCELNYQHISGPGKAIHAEYVYMDRSHCFSLASCSEVSSDPSLAL